MTQAVLPDGTVLEFPDETDPAVIQGAVKRMLGVEAGLGEDIEAAIGGEVAGVEEIAAAEELASVEGFTAAEAMATAQDLAGAEEVVTEPTEPTERPGFFERVSGDIEERQRMQKEILDAFASGDQTLIETVVQQTGKVGAGVIFDILGESLVSGMEGLSAITPDIIEDPIIQSATQVMHKFLNTDIGQAGLKAAEAGLETWNEFKAENPREARNIESVVDIGLLVAPIKSRPKIKARPTVAGEAASKFEAAGARQTARQKADFADDLVSPKLTAAVKKEQVARTGEEGFFRSKKVELSPAERAMADEVSLVEGVSKKNTLQGNFNAISKEVSKEAQTLKGLLAKNDVIIPRREFAAELDRAVVRLGENPLLVGDAEKTAAKVVNKMKQIVDGNPGTASGLLDSRKELDRWISTQKPKIFDPNQESALSLAVREVRQSTNDFIDTKAIDVGVKDSLKKQSTLLRAMDNIQPKAADEAGNIVLRAWQNANKVLDLRGGFNTTMAALLGVGGLGASAMFAPFYTALALSIPTAIFAGKAVMSPSAKKGVSKMLSAIDKAIRTTKDEALVTQLRLDRAALVELLKQSNE